MFTEVTVWNQEFGGQNRLRIGVGPEGDAMLRLTARELAELASGRLVGPADTVICDAARLECAGDADVAFLRDASRADQAARSNAAVLITPVEIEGRTGTQIVCEDVDLAMAAVLAEFAEARSARPEGVSPRAFIAEDVEIAERACVGAFAVVESNTTIAHDAVIYPHAYVGPNCRIGARTIVHAHVSIHGRVTLGEDCIIHYNAVIGAEGFGFLQREGRHVKIPQVGSVRIGNHVEIGALSTVDRAMLGETIIEDGTKVDNHCHIAHNCHVGPDCIMAGAAKLAGSVRLGRAVIVAEDVGVSDHVSVGDGAVLGARTGVHSDVEAGQVLLGSPARPIGEMRRIFAVMGRLPEMHQRLRTLQRRLDALTQDTTEDR